MTANRSDRLPAYECVEARVLKWPRRPIAATRLRVLGEDAYGRWLGVARGDLWWALDGSRRGVFEGPLVKVVPGGAFWTACFRAAEPVVDVDISLPVRWLDGAFEETDLELDVLRSAGGDVRVRDRDAFDRMRATWSLPDDIAAQAEAACAELRARVEARAEPFGDVGPAWLARFLSEVE